MGIKNAMTLEEENMQNGLSKIKAMNNLAINLIAQIDHSEETKEKFQEVIRGSNLDSTTKMELNNTFGIK